MATKTVANITLKDLDRMRALAKYSAGVVVEGRSNNYSIAFTYSAGAGWYTVEIQDGQETRRIEPDNDLRDFINGAWGRALKGAVGQDG